MRPHPTADSALRLLIILAILAGLLLAFVLGGR